MSKFFPFSVEPRFRKEQDHFSELIHLKVYHFSLKGNTRYEKSVPEMKGLDEIMYFEANFIKIRQKIR